MKRLHFFRNLHTTFLVLMACAIVAGIGGLWWANRTGLPASWRLRLEQELDKQGVHLQIGGLSYIPFRGIIASDIRIFADASRRHELSSLERVILALDRTKLARGKIRLTKIELSDADINLPVDPKNPGAEILHITGASGTVSMPGGRFLEIRDARGKVGGVDVIFGARMLGYRQTGGGPESDSEAGKRREVIARIIDILELCDFAETSAPQLRVFAEGDLSERTSLSARISLHAVDIGKNDHHLDELVAEGTFAANVLTLSSLRASDSHGSFDGRVDYDIENKSGRFDITSSLDLPALLQAWLPMPPLRDITLAGGQNLEAEGDFTLTAAGAPPRVRVTGRASFDDVTLRGVAFDSAGASFSWRDGELYLRDLNLVREDGSTEGKVLVKNPHVRLALHTTLPAEVYKPLFIGQPLEIVLDRVTPRDGAKFDIRLEGAINREIKTDWAFTGYGRVEHIDFNGVPVTSAQCGFDLNHHHLDFFQGIAEFDYTRYPLRKSFGGPATGSATMDRIRFDNETDTVTVENVAGSVWAAPVVRLFAPNIADGLETYRFHRPPALKASGVVGVGKNAPTTALDVSFKSTHPATYRFLGKDLDIASASGRVHVGKTAVDISNLELETLSGKASGRLTRKNDGKLAGEFNWSRLSLARLAETYEFDVKGDGSLTGRLDFSIDRDDIKTMDGEGLFTVEQTEIFSVPLFGPLAALIDKVISNKKGGYEQAKDAFFSFRIDDGILSTDDFRTANSSLNLTGEGSLDLSDKNVDVTMRMNARGFLGLITLPLRPFYGLFQFHGKGPLSKPEWESVLFTSPPEAQRKILLDPPRALPVAE